MEPVPVGSPVKGAVVVELDVDGVPVVALLTACSSRLAGSVTAGEDVEAPKSPLACCSWSACSLSFTISPDDEPSSFDCSEVEESTDETEDDPVFDSAWNRSETPELTDATELILLIVLSAELGKTLIPLL